MVKKRKLGVAEQRLVGLAPGSRSPDEAIQRIVKDLIGGLNCPPTPLEALFPRLGVVACVAVDMPISGELRRNGSELTIAYSSHLSATTRRFTIAHELGHAVFERTGPNCPRRGMDVERLCDELAAEILMPASVLRARLPQSLTLNEFMQLAREFDTSLTSMAIRISKFVGCTIFSFRDGTPLWAFGPERHVDPRTLGRNTSDGSDRPSTSETVYYPGRSSRGFHRIEWTSRGNLKLAMLLPVADSEVDDRLTSDDLRAYVQQVISSND